MSFKSSILKFTDSLAGPPLCWAMSCAQTRAEHRRVQDLEGPVLVIRPGGIGDAIMLLPMLKALQDALPDRRIDILCESRNRDIFRLAMPDAAVTAYDKTPFHALLSLRRTKYGTVIDTEQFHNFSGVMTALTQAPLRVGFKINTNRRGLYTHLVSYDLDGPEDVQFGRLLSAACGRVMTLPPRLGILASAKLPALPADLKISGPILVIHAGGSIASKRGPTKMLASVCRAAAVEFKMRPVIIGNGGDKVYADEILREAGEPAINLCGRLSLGETAALCKTAAAVVGPDSGIAHLAVALGTPAVVLFGPSDPAKWGPPEGSGQAIRNPLPCSPCSIFGYTKPCRRHECIEGITDAQILEALRGILITRNDAT